MKENEEGVEIDKKSLEIKRKDILLFLQKKNMVKDKNEVEY